MTVTTGATINSGAATITGTQVWVSGYDDLTLTIRIASNMVPNMPFDLSGINNSATKSMTFPCPIIVLWSQDMTLSVSNTDPTAPNDVPGTAPNAPGTVSRVKIWLIGEALNEAELRRRLTRQKLEEKQEEANLVKAMQANGAF
jgi:hypothetical protein